MIFQHAEDLFHRPGLRGGYGAAWLAALEKTRSNLPHLIVLDIMLPDIDGFEVCRILRTNTRTSHVPIIFLDPKR